MPDTRFQQVLALAVEGFRAYREHWLHASGSSSKPTGMTPEKTARQYREALDLLSVEATAEQWERVRKSVGYRWTRLMTPRSLETMGIERHSTPEAFFEITLPGTWIIFGTDPSTLRGGWVPDERETELMAEASRVSLLLSAIVWGPFREAALAAFLFAGEETAQVRTLDFPTRLRQYAPLLYGRSFVGAVATIRQLFNDVLNHSAVPTQDKTKISAACTAFDARFPKLRMIRNSAAHYEQRIQRRKSRGQRIIVQPLANPTPHNPGGMLIDSLFGDVYTVTLEDGTQGSIEVNLRSVDAIKDLINQLAGAFKWHGPPTRLPF